MAAINININLADQSSDGTGPYRLSCRRGATAPVDGTVLLSDTTDTKNPHELVEAAYQVAVDYIVGTLQTDLLN